MNVLGIASQQTLKDQRRHQVVAKWPRKCLQACLVQVQCNPIVAPPIYAVIIESKKETLQEMRGGGDGPAIWRPLPLVFHRQQWPLTVRIRCKKRTRVDVTLTMLFTCEVKQ
jgi:hypothetical protein